MEATEIEAMAAECFEQMEIWSSSNIKKYQIEKAILDAYYKGFYKGIESYSKKLKETTEV